MRALVISGYSGSGKSSAVKTLEDLGYYCIDNLPVSILPQLLALTGQFGSEITKLALVIDARDRRNIGDLPQIFKKAVKDGFHVELLFLEASDEVLVRRFSETRHRHPLSPSGSPTDGIAEERKLLAVVRKSADAVLDTSEFSSADLRRTLTERYGAAPTEKTMTITLTSFGYKHGLPTQSDLVFDVRFLANPFFKADLKTKSGTDPDVIDFVLSQPDAGEMVGEMKRMLEFVIPRYEREGKSYLHVAVGCTGGRHRSVVMATQLAKELKGLGYSPRIIHRDLERG
ncbi:MAG: RNase adapter RapZ [Pseudomonadota bacterium]